MREELRKQLIVEEGLRLKPYLDTVGKWTIGVGRNLSDVGITQDEAMLMLDNDLLRVESELSDRFDWFAALSPVRQDVLLDMAFNLGIKGLAQFHMTLTAITLGDYESASRQMLKSVWAEQVGQRAIRLAEQMRTGIR